LLADIQYPLKHGYGLVGTSEEICKNFESLLCVFFLSESPDDVEAKSE
jgi:hypothetical protein